MVLFFRWALNVVLLGAAVTCFVLAFSETHDTTFNRIMTFIVGVGFSIFCGFFTRATITIKH